MRPSSLRLAILVAPLLAVMHARTSLADDGAPPQPPSSTFVPVPTSVPLYPAPLSQEVQTTYVPQSIALSGPLEIEATDEYRAAPAGYTAVMRKRTDLTRSGAALLGLSYGLCALTAAIGQDSSSGRDNPVAAMWIPVAGPFVQLSSTSSATADLLLLGLGGVQVVGAISLYYGLTTTQRVFVRNDLLGAVTVSPMVGNGTSGMVLAGRF